jgi:hypothetical protein
VYVGLSKSGCLLVKSIQDGCESHSRGQEHGLIWKDVPISTNAGFRTLTSLHSSWYGCGCHGLDAIYGEWERRRYGQVWYSKEGSCHIDYPLGILPFGW